MTLEKIKHYMDETAWLFWTSLAENKEISLEAKIAALEKAKKTLSEELKSGLLKGVKYEAELSLIKHFLS